MRSSRMITAVEAHAEGEPGRVITGGLPPIPGTSVFEKMQWMQANADDIRLFMLREPRGNPALCCNALVPPCHPEADAGVIIMEQTEYPPMSGSNVICSVTVRLSSCATEAATFATSSTIRVGVVDMAKRLPRGDLQRV